MPQPLIQECYPRKTLTQKVRSLAVNTLLLLASLALTFIAAASAFGPVLHALFGWP